MQKSNINQSMEEEYSSETTSSVGSTQPRKSKRLLWVVLVVIILGGAWYAKAWMGVDAPSDKWQVVFLTGGQAYFGHLTTKTDSYVLKDIFYLRANPALQQNTPSSSSFDLVKLGGELHGPEDTMYITKTNVLFWENMKAESQVSQAIKNFLAQDKK